MSWPRIILGILLFAAATAILYAWGLSKSMTQQEDSLAMLRNKCANLVLKKMKQEGTLTKKQVEELIAGVRAGMPWSRQKAVVQDPKAFAEAVLRFLEEQAYIERSGNGYRRR